MKKSKIIIKSVSFEKKLFEEIEKRRGLIPRSTFINHILRRDVKVITADKPETSTHAQQQTEVA